MATKKKNTSSQLTFTHLIVTAIVMLVAGYLFGRFSVVVPGIAGTSTVDVPTIAGGVTGPNIEALRRAAEDSPDSASAWTALGNAYFDAGLNTEAIDAYTKSLEIDGGNPNVWTDRGIMYRRIGDPAQAIMDFDTAASMDPTHLMSRFNKGIVLYNDLNDTAGARSAFEQVLEMDPDFVTPSGAYLENFMRTLN